MRILLVADIHSNWPALQAIQEPFDACLVLGDIVDYATDPRPCIDWVRQFGTAGIRGNHDHAVAQRIQTRKKTGLGKLATAARPLHWEILTTEELAFLGRLPAVRRLELDSKKFFLVHATPRDPFDEYLKQDETAWAARTEGIDADFICVGHSHQPFVLQVGDKTVINPGSVGQPRDGNPECAYCIIEDGEVSLRRVPYDIDATLQQMQQMGVAPDTIDLAGHFLRTGGRLPPNEIGETAAC